MSKTYSAFISEVEHPAKFNKLVKQMHGVKDHADPAQDPENYTPVVGKTATPPKGKKSIKEQDSYLDAEVSDTQSMIYNYLQQLDLIADSVIYSDQHSKTSLFVSMLGDLVAAFADEGAKTAEPESAPEHPSEAEPVSEPYHDYYESYTAGPLTLNDGTEVQLTNEQCDALNKMGSSAKGSLDKTLKKNLKEFEALVDYAMTLNEQVASDD